VSINFLIQFTERSRDALGIIIFFFDYNFVMMDKFLDCREERQLSLGTFQIDLVANGI